MHVTTHVDEAPAMMVEHAQPDPVIEVPEAVPAVTYAALAPVVQESATTPTVTYVEQVPVDVHNVPPPAVYFAALAPVVEYIAPAPADTSSTSVCVGDTSWSLHCRHCEVFRIGDRDYEDQVRVLHADEDPHSCAWSTWIPCRIFKPDGKRARLRSCAPLDAVRDGNRRGIKMPGTWSSPACLSCLESWRWRAHDALCVGEAPRTCGPLFLILRFLGRS